MSEYCAEMREEDGPKYKEGKVKSVEVKINSSI